MIRSLECACVREKFYGRVGISLGGGEFILGKASFRPEGVISRLAPSQLEGAYLGASMSLVEASMSLVGEEFGMFLVGDVICDLWSC